MKVTWQDVTGAQHTDTFDANNGDFLATITQHEYDHLKGTLFLDHISPPHLTMLRKKLKEIEKDFKRSTGKAGAVLRRRLTIARNMTSLALI